jgi:hypothetical protein
MDIYAIHSDKVVIAECKATKSKIKSDVIDKWIDVKIPAFKAYVGKQDICKKRKLEFEFWSTGGFTKAALQRLEKFSHTAQKFKVSYFQADDMRVKAKQMDNKKLKEALDNFFLKIDV